MALLNRKFLGVPLWGAVAVGATAAIAAFAYSRCRSDNDDELVLKPSARKSQHESLRVTAQDDDGDWETDSSAGEEAGGSRLRKQERLLRKRRANPETFSNDDAAQLQELLAEYMAAGAPRSGAGLDGWGAVDDDEDFDDDYDDDEEDYYNDPRYGDFEEEDEEDGGWGETARNPGQPATGARKQYEREMHALMAQAAKYEARQNALSKRKEQKRIVELDDEGLPIVEDDGDEDWEDETSEDEQPASKAKPSRRR